MKTIITVKAVFDDESDADVFVDGLSQLDDEGVFPTGAEIKRDYDYQWESDSDKYIDVEGTPPSHGFVEALNDYCQDYYKHYDGYPVEFEYKDKVYPYEYYVKYLPPSVQDYPREEGRD